MPTSIAGLFEAAKRQHGLFRRADAYSSGVTWKRVATLVRNGVVDAVAPSVFRVCGSPETWDQRTLAAVWAGGAECWAAAQTAAVLDRFDIATFDGPIDVMVTETGRGYRRASVRVHATSLLLPEDICVVRGIPCLDPIRTWLSLAASMPLHRLEEILDAAERDALIRRDELLRRLALLQVSGRNGTGVADRLLRDRAPTGTTPTNAFERQFFRLLERASLGNGVCQYQIRRGDGRTALIDYAWPDLQCGVELDGHVAHATRAQRRSDNERQRSLQDVGFELIRFSWEEVKDSPETVTAGVRSMLARRNDGFARARTPVSAPPQDQNRGGRPRRTGTVRG